MGSGPMDLTHRGYRLNLQLRTHWGLPGCIRRAFLVFMKVLFRVPVGLQSVDLIIHGFQYPQRSGNGFSPPPIHTPLIQRLDLYSKILTPVTMVFPSSFSLVSAVMKVLNQSPATSKYAYSWKGCILSSNRKQNVLFTPPKDLRSKIFNDRFICPVWPSPKPDSDATYHKSVPKNIFLAAPEVPRAHLHWRWRY